MAFRHEQRVQNVFASLFDDGASPTIAQLADTPALTAQLIRGGVLSVIRARMSDTEGDGEPLVELAQPLTSFIAVAYLGQAAASDELARRLAGGESATCSCARAGAGLGERLSDSRSRAARRLVLDAIARAPRSSNREIAAAAGILDEGQISHLLRRLAQRGLIAKVAPRSGSRRDNAWLLTPRPARDRAARPRPLCPGRSVNVTRQLAAA